MMKEQLTKKVDAKLAWGIIGILSIGLIIWAVSCNNKTKLEVSNIGDEVVEQNAIEAEKGAAAKKPAAASMSYAQALETYKDRRIQFDKACQATPNNVTYKNGTKIMLDNRAGVARTININGAVSLPAYGFKIVTLSSSTLPKTILVDCGTGQNVATILIQK